MGDSSTEGSLILFLYNEKSSKSYPIMLFMFNSV